jgi:hypothetical protein
MIPRGMPGMESEKGSSADNTQSDSSKSPVTNSKIQGGFLCEFCGPQKPAEQVFVCTLCTMNFCVRHLNSMFHFCHGALGKPQTVGAYY